MKQPAFQFYPGDWLHDTALRTCSICARGLWMDMLCIMHQAEPYGHLLVNSQPVQPDALARMVGETVAKVKSYIAELGRAGVYDIHEGVIVSRRMVRDEHIREVRRNAGILGGNPNLVKQNASKNTPCEVKQTDKQSPTPSSSTSSSSSLNSKTEPSAIADPWRAGKDYLMAHRVPEKKAGSIIGMWVKDYGKNATITALQAAINADAAEPVEYVAAVLQNRPKNQKFDPVAYNAQLSRNQ